jgi:thioredoxin 1
MSAVHFTKDNFDKSVLKSKKPVMVDFFAEWCGPCKLAGPVIDELAKENAGKIVIGKVDVGKEQQLAQQYNVMSIPTIVIFNNGKEVDRKIGFPGKESYQAMLDKVISKE